MRRFEYRVIDTGRDVEAQLNGLGAEGWQVVGVTTRKQLLIAPPAAVILMRELQPAGPQGGFEAPTEADEGAASAPIRAWSVLDAD
jgi:hypothetical protein